MKMSKSRLLVFLQCPERFRLQYVLKLEDREEPEEGSPLKKGIELHQVFEDYYKVEEAKEVENESDILDILLQHPLAHKEDEELEREYHSHLANFAAYNAAELEAKGPEKYIPPGRELNLYDKELDFQGIIDRVENSEDNTFNIVDYKTGRPGTLKKYVLELALYKILFERKTGKKADKVGIYFSKNGKLRLTKITKEDEEKALKVMADARKQIDDGFFPKMPGFLCRFCNFENICSEGEPF